MTSGHEHHTIESLIDRHFAGRMDPGGERHMREALVSCDGCKAYYDRHLLLARLDPRALDARTRLARGLGLGGSRFWRRTWGGIAALAVTTAALLLFAPRLATDLVSSRPSVFGVRGAGDVQVRLFVHRLSKQHAPERLGKKMAATDELAFAYQNPASFSHLLVFAVDGAKRVYWYHPAWTDAKQRPSAISIQSGAQVRELPAAISHRLSPGHLRIFGVFANRPLTVDEVEKAVSAMRADATRLNLPETTQVVESVEVEP